MRLSPHVSRLWACAVLILILTTCDGRDEPMGPLPGPVQEPIAAAGGPYAGTEGVAVTFDGGGSHDPAIPPSQLTYAWSFGDGSTGTDPQPSHTYVDGGSYSVVLRVTSAQGIVSAPDTSIVVVANAVPAVGLTVSPEAVTAGDAVSATGTFTDPGNEDSPWQWELDWGNGTKQSGSMTTASVIAGSHGYESRGSYTVRLSVTDRDGGTGTAVRTVTVSDDPTPTPAAPQADAGGPYAAQEGSVIAFDGSGSAGTGALTYAWTFGDGSSDTAVDPTHTFADDGTYTVVLTVTDENGLTSAPDTATATVGNVAPSASFALSPDPVTVGQNVTASGSFSDPGTQDGPWQWEIDWGDGTKQSGDAASVSAAIGASHSYEAAGAYTVRLSITDSDGGTGAVERAVDVSPGGGPQAPNAEFDFSTDNLEVTFSDGSTDPDGAVTAWEWSFGDGTVGTVRHPIHTYAAAGTYTARLSATDDTGLTHSRQHTVTVSGVGTSKTMLVGAGDIAGCGTDQFGNTYQDEATAALLDRFPDATVFTTGDNVYDNGTAAEFAQCYDPTWGRFKSRTMPAAGNHEYNISPAPYFDYFAAAAGEPDRGYYTYTRGSWLVVVLNSGISVAAGSAQEQWLRATLSQNPRQCTLAMMHHPRFSSIRGDNRDVNMTPVWQALYDYDVDLVIASHDHAYERFAPRAPNGALDGARGIRQITVGTGGGRLYPISSISPLSEAINNQAHGVLKLTLDDGSYSWEFVPVAGRSFTDSGRGGCH